MVKMTMQDNIQQMLANEERLDQISQNAENLNEQVGFVVLESERLHIVRHGEHFSRTPRVMSSREIREKEKPKLQDCPVKVDSSGSMRCSGAKGLDWKRKTQWYDRGF